MQQNPFLWGIAGGYAINTVTPYLNGLIRFTFNTAIGEGGEFPTGAKRMLRKLKGEDLKKLVHRIEPPLTRAHAVIGKSADTMTFTSKRTDLAILNSETKSYMEAKKTDDFETFDTNVTSFNVLTGNGRLFDPDVEETAAFSLATDPISGTKKTIIGSMDQFASGRNGTIRITAQRVETIEHRLKKYIISAAEEIPQSDWIDGSDPMRSPRK